MSGSPPAEPVDADLGEIVTTAAIYLYPLVLMELTRRESVADGGAGEVGRSGGSPLPPFNRFAHLRAFPEVGFTTVVRPNFDTLYSSAWLDLTAGPVVLSSGGVPDGRYFQLPLYDMWTDAFASPGRRTTGTGPGRWVVVPPGWTGRLPDGVDRIDAPTPHVWIIGRTQTNGTADYGTVHRIQDGFTLEPLHQGPADHGCRPVVSPTTGVRTDPEPGSGTGPETDGAPAPDADRSPLGRIGAMGAEEFFNLGLALMAVHPPHATDWSLIKRMAGIGLVAGATVAGLEPAVRRDLDAAPSEARAILARALPGLATVRNGWQMNIDTMGVYGNFYVKRAIVAMIGLGANSPEDAVYPMLQVDADGETVKGDARYVLHFDAGELPPVHAFWSVTMYDHRGFPVANPIHRYAIGDRDPLVANADGSLDLHIGPDSPGQNLETNWLPSAPGRVGITMRLYAPKPSVLDGTWTPPAVRRTG